MHEVVTLDGAPFVEAMTRPRFGGGSVKMQPGWDVVASRNGDTTSVLRSGLAASTVTHDPAAGDAVLAVTFKASGLRFD
ncbi:hypothetical protein Amn_02780 [Aminobacter sp. Y103A]|uniref:hypothetical protein n=1 Tax=Aminobacter sp. Y103A TaxID=1870862 RepID=UPI002573DADB|nr:hypothetical protein [Aminobacter sp. SS-2016]BBD35398.1 hypothetical protein Amn_02780 [Aminobacter sp. SS-2016]